jgi:hypothetical protein
MFCAALDPEHVAGQIEPANLTASVDTYLAGPHRTAQDLVKIID